MIKLRVGSQKRVTAPQAKTEEEVPGPGKYEQNLLTTYRSVNWQNQGQREILKESRKDSIGPGSYDLKGSIGEGGPKVNKL